MTDHPTQFEADFSLRPMGDDLEGRLQRAERLLGLFLRAATNEDIRLAHIWTGTAFPSEHNVPVPDDSVVQSMLDEFRTTEFLERREEMAYTGYDD